MNKAGKLVIALLIVAVVAAGAYLLTKNSDDNKTPTNGTTPTTSESSEESKSEGEPAEGATITYNGSGFEASTTTVKSGEQVTVINESDKTLHFDSDPHPAHTNNTELNVGEIPAGETMTVTLDKKGNWGYHNHFNASQRGQLIVE